MSAAQPLTSSEEAPRSRGFTIGSVVGFAVLGSIFAKSMAERLAEHDLWWHLKTGQLIVATHHLPRGDPFSFTVPGKSWVIQQWGSEVILRLIKVGAGLRGIIVWRSVMLVAIYAVMAWLFVRIGGNRLTTWALVALAAYAGVPDWIERPTLFSFLIFALVLCLTLRPTRRIWWCIPLFVLWANLHALVILGLGYLILISASETLKEAAGTGDPASARRLRLVTVASIVGTFLNPYGPKLLAYAISLTGTVSSTNTEWASPNFHASSTLPFLVLILVTIAALALSKQAADPTDIALVVAFLGLGLYAERNLPISAMVLGAIALRHLPDALASIAPRVPSEQPSRIAVVPAVAIVLIVSFALGFLAWDRFPRSDAVTAVADQGFPIATIQALPSSGVRLFSDDRWAALAIYLRWPGTHVAFDGRGDLYGKTIIAKYESTIDGRPDWETWLDQICANYVLVQEHGGLANVIESSPDWRLVRRDPIEGGQAVLLTRPTPALGCHA